jgi:hypothetical protein
MKRKKPPPPRFQIGDRVLVELARRKVDGVIVEDRGPFGVGGRRLYYVEIPIDPDEPMHSMFQEEEIEPDNRPPLTPASIDKAKVIEYLKNGALISILITNTPGGRNQPRVWIRPDTLGNLTHTFAPDRGVLGGAQVPFATMNLNTKVFLDKKEEVIGFLGSFGLTREEAEEVIRAFGTARRVNHRVK